LQQLRRQYVGNGAAQAPSPWPAPPNEPSQAAHRLHEGAGDPNAPQTYFMAIDPNQKRFQVELLMEYAMDFLYPHDWSVGHGGILSLQRRVRVRGAQLRLELFRHGSGV
jgi:hypothetical protein